MADPHDDLTAIVDEVRRVAMLPPAQSLRHRSDRRRRCRRAVTGVGLVVLAVAAGAGLVRVRDQVVTPVSSVPPPVTPSATGSAGPRDMLSGRRQVRVLVPGLNGAALAIGRDDRVRAGAEPGAGDRALWVLRPEGNKFRIELAAPPGAGRVCMTVVHDAAPGSVRGRACDPAAPAQLFRIDRLADGSYSIFQGRRYVQVVDGTNALVPDLPEGLTTTYAFEDHGPVAGVLPIN
nr:hypothetical protein [uncultured Actinoplanes sp.]